MMHFKIYNLEHIQHNVRGTLRDRFRPERAIKSWQRKRKTRTESKELGFMAKYLDYVISKSIVSWGPCPEIEYAHIS